MGEEPPPNHPLHLPLVKNEQIGPPPTILIKCKYWSCICCPPRCPSDAADSPAAEKSFMFIKELCNSMCHNRPECVCVSVCGSEYVCECVCVNVCVRVCVKTFISHVQAARLIVCSQWKLTEYVFNYCALVLFQGTCTLLQYLYFIPLYTTFIWQQILFTLKIKILNTEESVELMKVQTFLS